MRYKSIPFTFEEWQKDPEGRKIIQDGKQSHTAVYFPNRGIISIIWNDTSASNYSLKYAEESFGLLIPVKTVRKWRREGKYGCGFWHEFNPAKLDDCFAILSAEFDEDGNYVKGSIKVEEV